MVWKTLVLRRYWLALIALACLFAFIRPLVSRSLAMIAVYWLHFEFTCELFSNMIPIFKQLNIRLDVFKSRDVYYSIHTSIVRPIEPKI